VLKGDLKSAIEMHEMLYQIIQRHNFLPEVSLHQSLCNETYLGTEGLGSQSGDNCENCVDVGTLVAGIYLYLSIF